jgi:hypothetical protein
LRLASPGREASILKRIIPVTTLLLVASFVIPRSAEAQGYTFTVNGLLGVGGSIDETDPGFGNLNWQLGFSNVLGGTGNLVLVSSLAHYGDFFQERCVAGKGRLAR